MFHFTYLGIKMSHIFNNTGLEWTFKSQGITLFLYFGKGPLWDFVKIE